MGDALSGMVASIPSTMELCTYLQEGICGYEEQTVLGEWEDA